MSDNRHGDMHNRDTCRGVQGGTGIFFGGVVRASSLSRASGGELVRSVRRSGLFPVRQSSSGKIVPRRLRRGRLGRVVGGRKGCCPFLLSTFRGSKGRVGGVRKLLTFHIPCFINPLIIPRSLRGSSGDRGR